MRSQSDFSIEEMKLWIVLTEKIDQGPNVPSKFYVWSKGKKEPVVVVFHPPSSWEKEWQKYGNDSVRSVPSQKILDMVRPLTCDDRIKYSAYHEHYTGGPLSVHECNASYMISRPIDYILDYFTWFYSAEKAWDEVFRILADLGTEVEWVPRS